MHIKNLQPGQIVYDVGRQRMGNTTMSTVVVWEVRIVSVDQGQGVCVASWNSNPPRPYGGHDITHWRLTRPTLIKNGLGYRLAKRGEMAPEK